MERRAFLSAGIASLLLPSSVYGQSLVRTRDNLPTPNLDGPFKVWKGLRPYRANGPRLEVLDLPSKLLVHNYGHGGGGITLSWGTADWVHQQLLSRALSPDTTSVAVLGSGVVGLATATVLRQAGYAVTIYTDKLWQDTTSAVAGGQIAPSLVDAPAGVDFQELVNVAYQVHAQRGVSFGVTPKDNYTHARATDLNMIAQANGTTPQRLDRLPFQSANAGGWKYQTLIANPTILLPKLEKDLRAASVEFVLGMLTLNSINDLSQPVIVNCLGLGSGGIWPDAGLYAKKGILAVFPAQSRLNYLYSSIGYVFPRDDHLIVGGTIEDLAVGVTNRNATTTPNISDEQKAAFVVRIVKRVFNGDIPVPGWFSGAGRIPSGMFTDSNIDLGFSPSPMPSIN